MDFDEAPEEGKPFSFTAVVTVMPKAELGEYKGVEAPRPDERSWTPRSTSAWSVCGRSSPN